MSIAAEQIPAQPLFPQPTPLFLGHFGDKRLDRRGAAFFDAMLEKQTVCLRRLAGGDRASEVGFGAFLDNDKVTVPLLIRGWSDRTCEAVDGRHVLAIQDTSEIHISTCARHRRGLGFVGKGNTRGLLCHAMVGVDADSGACLGLVTGQIYNREHRVTIPSSQRSMEEREARRWGETAQAAKPILAGARMVTAISDREGDIYHYWASAPGPNFHLLTRMMQDRGVAGGGTVFKTTLAWPFQDMTREVKLSATADRAARKATLSLRFGEVTIRRPHRKGITHLPETITLRYVEAIERDPPDGVDPLHWRLMTTHAVDSVAMAWQIVDWYRMRWIIEQLFRLMKTDGLGLEDSQVETAEALMKLTAIAAKTACVTLQLVQARDGCAEPASHVFSPIEIAVLEAMNAKIQGKTAKQKNPHARHSLSWATWVIARTGGWSGYPSARRPGPITMKRGYEIFKILAAGWQLLRDALLSLGNMDVYNIIQHRQPA